MSRAAIQWKRAADGDWDPVGVWFATSKGLQSRVLPGQGYDGFFKRIHQTARPPVLDDGTYGTWEDFIEYALDALSNGHDMMVSEVKPLLTLDQTYAHYVLGLTGKALSRWKPSTIPNVTTIPTSQLRGPIDEALRPPRGTTQA
jgi:hypothetical protein